MTTFLLVTVIILSYLYITRRNKEDISEYCVQGGYATQCTYSDKKQAANIMKKLDEVGYQLLDYLERIHGPSPGIRGKIAKNLRNRYKGAEALRETHPGNRDNDTSYTIDKGDILSLCLRESNGDLHDFENLKFVYFHELAHIGGDVYQHPKKYWQIFKILLQEAEAAGLYTPYDYGRMPYKYCGQLTISYNPYYDDTLEDID